MPFSELSLADCAKHIVDNRGRTCPVGDEGMPLIATNCLRAGGLYPTYETTRFVSDETYRTWFRGHPQPGDIIFVTKGSPGRICLAPDPVDFCIAQDMVAIRADESKVYPRYLFAVLRSQEAQQRIENMHVGTLIPHFKKGDFDKLLLPIPDSTNQREIGDLYFELSSRIDLLQRTNATLEAIAQALFKWWFVDFDPVRAKAEGRDPEGVSPEVAVLFPSEFVDSELGEIPKGWRSGTLADIAQLNPESWTAKNHPSTVSYIDLANTKDNVIADVTDYVFDEAPSRARRVLRDGDTIVGTVRPGNRSFAYIHEPPSNLTASTGFAVFRPTGVHHAVFLYLAATQDSSIEHLAHVADGAAYPAVRPEVVAGIQCTIPNDDVMRVFHSVAAPMLWSIAENHRKAGTLAELRDTLLPRLMSGKLRIPEAQEATEEAPV